MRLGSLLSLIWTLVFCFPHSVSGASDLLDVRLGGLDDDRGSRVVLEFREATALRAFTLSSPPRFVVDVAEPPAEAIPRFQDLPGRGLVKGVRGGLFRRGILRIVFDLEQSAVIANRLILNRDGRTIQASADEPHRYVFDLMVSKQKIAESSFESEQWSGYQVSLDRQTAEQASRASPRDPEIYRPGIPPLRPQIRQSPLIVVDPGHGGIDPGAVAHGGKTLEKNITLAVSRLVANELKKRGYAVRLTRSEDVYVKLRERYQIAEQLGADLFVSLHADSNPVRRVRGMSVYVLSDVASDQEARRLAQQENRSDILAGVVSVDDNLISSILLDIQQRETKQESVLLAHLVIDEMSLVSQTVSNTLRSAGFAVLKSAVVPSVLVELGYLSNDRESRLLLLDSYRRKLALALSKSIDDFFRRRYRLERS